MKEVTIAYHEATVAGGNEVTFTIDDTDEVKVLDGRTIAGVDTRFQFAVVSTKRHDGDGTRRRRDA